jgi:hypothetical protein
MAVEKRSPFISRVHVFVQTPAWDWYLATAVDPFARCGVLDAVRIN